MTRTLAASLLAATILATPAHAQSVREIAGRILVDPTVEELNSKCDRYISAIETRRTALESGTGVATVDNTLVPYDEIFGLISSGDGEFTVYQEVLLEPELRDAGGECSVRLGSIASEISLSRPIYDRLAAIDRTGLDGLTNSYLTDLVAEFERSGVALPDAQRARVQAIQERLGELSTELARNVAEDVRTIQVRPDELAGLPQDFIDGHEAGDDGMITLTTAYPDYQPVMTYGTNDELRRRFAEVYAQRAWPANDEVLREIFTLRSELAGILGRENYAALALEDKMLKTPERVRELLADTEAVARPIAEQDYARNLAVLQQLQPGAARIEPWQLGYVANRAQIELYDYDTQEARKYFAYNDVRDGVLELTEDLFDVEIRQWDTAVWHPDVEAYEMVDDGNVIGRFYFDNHPRPGKYTHANMVPIYPGVPGPNGTIEDVPVGALVQNLPKGDHSTGLMEHRDVQTLLHEFGHMIHGMFGGTQRWFGQNFLTVEWDVVEAPSQMLENWVYDYDTLAKFAKDAQGNTIPRELVEKMNRVRHFNEAIGEMRQLGLTNVSLNFHTMPVPQDMGAATRAWNSEYAIIPSPDYDQMQAAFNHLDGYSAFYYTYLWSRVVGADLFTRFENEGLRNQRTADAYRRAILEPGGTKPAEELIRDFLGRDVELDAFREGLEKGLE